MKQWTILCLAILTIFSCKDYRNTQAVMDRAESLMNEAPDSSLALLNGVDRKKLTRRGSKARFTLLLSMAQHKCYMDMSADTCLRAAYEWYQQHGSERNKMLSAYYLGLFHEQAGDNIEAVLAFAEAESLAQSLQDYRQLSLVEQHLSAIFANNYDYVRAQDYAERSLMAAEQAGEVLMCDYCKYDIAVQLIAQYKYDEAKELLLSISQRNNTDSPIYSLAVKELAKVYFFSNEAKYDVAKQCYHDVTEARTIPLDSHDYGILAVISELEGNSKQADLYMIAAEKELRTPVDSVVFYNDYRNLYDVRRDWKNAHYAKTESAKIQDRIVIQLLGHSLAHAMKDYYANKWELERVRSQSKLYLFLLVGLALIILISIALVLIHRRNRLALEDMARIQDMSSEMLNTLIEDKIKDLQRLSESYFSWEDTSIRKIEEKKGRQTRDEIISIFRTQLSELRNDHSFFCTLEQSLNLTKNDIMTKARRVLSKEKELDFSILALLFSGFPIKCISFLLRMSEASIRMRKTRYKQRFISLNEPERSLFLEEIG